MGSDERCATLKCVGQPRLDQIASVFRSKSAHRLDAKRRGISGIFRKNRPCNLTDHFLRPTFGLFTARGCTRVSDPNEATSSRGVE